MLNQKYLIKKFRNNGLLRDHLSIYNKPNIMTHRQPTPKKVYKYVAPSEAITKIEALKQMNERLQVVIDNIKSELDNCTTQ